MLLLEYSNRILEDAVRARLEAEKPEAVDIVFADFDGVGFHLSSDPNDKSQITISIQWNCIDDLLKHGAEAELKRVYGAGLLSQPEPGYNVSLRLDLNNPPSDKEAYIQSVGLLKRNVLAAPFLKTFQALEKGGAPPGVITIKYRADEAFYIKPDQDRCIVIFSIYFSDADDQVLAKVFLQEFADARRTISGAPTVTFSQKDPPMELQEIGIKTADAKIGYVSFVLFPAHINSTNAQRTVSQIQTFRDYLHYHIKCSKAHLHERMRNRVAALLMILNRAKPEPIVPKEKKLISGKTFVRADGGGARGRGLAIRGGAAGAPARGGAAAAAPAPAARGAPAGRGFARGRG